jgi:hypothetical protein
MIPDTVEGMNEPMVWHYHCPQCGRALETPWDDIALEVTCPDCNAAHYAPTPSEDHAAHVGEESWPQEMEDVVVALRGSACVVPGCYREHTTLVPRLPYTKGGRSSVENLVPACAEHAAARGEGDYGEWLARFARKEPDVAASGITITTTDRCEMPSQTFGQIVGVQPVAGQVSFPGPFPAGARLLFAAPFLPGPANRLVFYYEWKLDPGESCRVILGAWPRAEELSFTKGFGESKGYTTNDHRAGECRESSALLEMVLPESRDELWVVAVWVQAQSERPTITSYYLAAVIDQPESDVI